MADSPRAQAVLNSARTNYPRLEDQIEWYDGKSVHHQRWYRRLKVTSIAAAALVPARAAQAIASRPDSLVVWRGRGAYFGGFSAIELRSDRSRALVLSDRAGEREYFGDHADYVCPADLPAMMDAIRKALVGAADAPARAARTAHIRSSFPWDAHARGTAAVYRAVLAEHPARRAHANRLFSFPDRMSLNAYMRRHIPFLRTSASAM